MESSQAIEDKGPSGFTHLPGEGQAVLVRGGLITFKATSQETKGAWALVEYTIPPHSPGPPRHRHQQTLEGFYILAGTLTFQLEEQVIEAPAGSFILIPPGVTHNFSNEEAVPATFLMFISPGGSERYFEELAALLQAETSWPPADMSKYAALSLKYDQYPPSTG